MHLVLFYYYFGLSVCISGIIFYPLSGSPECSRPSGRWRGQQPEAGSMHVQLKQALVGVAATRLREQDDEVWVRDEDDDDDDDGNK